MIQPRAALRHVLRFIGIYLLLVIPRPGIDAVSGAATRTAANLSLGRIPGVGHVRYEKLLAMDSDRRDIRMALLSPDGDAIGERRVNSRHLAFLPVATLLALVLASPLSWQKRASLGAAALGITAIFIAFRIALSAMQGFSEAGALAAWHPYARAALWRSEAVFVSLPSSWFLGPMLIWGGVVWFWTERLRARTPTEAAAS